MKLRKQQRGAARPPAEDIGLEQGSESQGLDSLLSQFMPDPEAAAAAVRNWTPSRRGNSPHHGADRPTTEGASEPFSAWRPAT